ncbi:hypothetical protein HBI56_184290 [Parastagonospora nodorum]|uniref:Uncharacterized protein n=1 Tax=Phaeosphaeria nodorum (strain SN15 / ATCC MYA-4574 / FGSC 10173) TaxID=321614 RepID=Q0U250_PHANO|nr:hypothetical protein SNOG_14216 [Parastagonospora nodorum SN15]KAH3907285.1 hypothetical protein HBH56_192760 [Parastagonospora nodorum]EAT78453.1 hypothetical protein SNOG_14216 [Parastagonospora nodorum SN15]KAH3938231.1 hypothetical protein HBH54_009200 [Parastagonospora nodorum]KAH3940741.1 hypothetical protein HBH53_213100 [Parastagonospora nodorum]KAH3966448.1 hypothetical protein HBH52_198160 [Parastagonospora nodorum]
MEVSKLVVPASPAPSPCVIDLPGVRLGLERLENRAEPWSLITPWTEVAVCEQAKDLAASPSKGVKGWRRQQPRLLQRSNQWTVLK